MLTQAKSFWAKHKGSENGSLRQMKIEDKASGTGLIQQLKQAGVPVAGIQRNKDKVTRAYDAAPMAEAGNVYLPDSADYISDLLAELSGFPVAAHDDQVDPLMDAISDMLIGSGKIDVFE